MRPASATELGIVLDGVEWDVNLGPAFHPFRPLVVAVEPWPSHLFGAPIDACARWLAEFRVERPLLGLTARRCVDADGCPVRGWAIQAGGIGVVSTLALSRRQWPGVIRHELAHAVGLGHCDDPACCLHQRPWPVPLTGRSQQLCDVCEAIWMRTTSGEPC